MGPTERPAKEELRRAYDEYADVYSSRFANPQAIARRQVHLIRHWGRPVGRGATILEIGCADGYITEGLLGAGFRVHAIDLSPRMIELARQRLAAYDDQVTFQVGDIHQLEFDRKFDVVLAVMRTFFRYVDEPVAMLTRLRQHTLTKTFIDANPRSHSIKVATAAMSQAGFHRIRWRPLLVPQNLKIGRIAYAAGLVAEETPLVRRILVRRHFNIAIKGEVIAE